MPKRIKPVVGSVDSENAVTADKIVVHGNMSIGGTPADAIKPYQLDYRRIYYEGFDVEGPDPQLLRERYGSFWLIGEMQCWFGEFQNGLHLVKNHEGAGQCFHTCIKYSEGDQNVALGDSMVSVRVRLGPPTDKHSSGGIIYRKNKKGDGFYSFVLHAGNCVSFANTTRNSLKFLWSQELDTQSTDGFVTLKMVGRGSEIDLYVNNTLVHTMSGMRRRNGDPGIMLLSVGSYAFDDFSIFIRSK